VQIECVRHRSSATCVQKIYDRARLCASKWWKIERESDNQQLPPLSNSSHKLPYKFFLSCALTGIWPTFALWPLAGESVRFNQLFFFLAVQNLLSATTLLLSRETTQTASYSTLLNHKFWPRRKGSLQPITLTDCGASSCHSAPYSHSRHTETLISVYNINLCVGKKANAYERVGTEKELHWHF